MKRRAFVQLAAAAAVLSPLEKLTCAAAAAPLPDASLATLRALAPVVLPASLGRRRIELLTDRFLDRLAGHRAGVDMDYGYGHPVLRTTAESPASRYVEQLAALERAAADRGRDFARLPADAKRALITAAIRDSRLERLPAIPDGGHVVTDLMAFYFNSSEANDDCYRAGIGREKCRPIASITVRPKPLTATRES